MQAGGLPSFSGKRPPNNQTKGGQVMKQDSIFGVIRKALKEDDSVFFAVLEHLLSRVAVTQ
jgi:hypothetical protein